ncbi:hypothetical protein [Nitrospira sp. Kam-Ns4a]
MLTTVQDPLAPPREASATEVPRGSALGPRGPGRRSTFQRELVELAGETERSGSDPDAELRTLDGGWLAPVPGLASAARLGGRLSGGPDPRPESGAARAGRAPRPASLALARAREPLADGRAAAQPAAWRQARAVSAVGDSDHAARPSDSREEPARADRPPAAALRPEDESGRHVESAPSADQPEDPAWSQVEVLNVAARREPGMDGRALAAPGARAARPPAGGVARPRRRASRRRPRAGPPGPLTTGSCRGRRPVARPAGQPGRRPRRQRA